MSIFWTVVVTILIFGVLIFSHELGHLLFAKANKIYVEEFAVGMGLKLFSFRIGETQYSLRLFPIGGYCKMPGEDGESEHPNGFDKKSVPRRMLVVFGGAFFNFILAILIFIIAYGMMGAPATEPIIGDVSENMPAVAAGVEAGDTILAIDGKDVDTWEEAVAIISAQPDTEMTYTLEHENGEVYDTAITSTTNEQGTGVIGIVRGTERLSLFGAISVGFQRTYEMTKLILVTLYQMITGQIGVDLAGPIGVGQMVSQVADYGFWNLLIFAAVLSVNLGVINLLPLPALDGSRLVFLAIEGIRRRPISPRVEGAIHFVGFVLLMLLMVIVTYSDILRIAG